MYIISKRLGVVSNIPDLPPRCPPTPPLPNISPHECLHNIYMYMYTLYIHYIYIIYTLYIIYIHYIYILYTLYTHSIYIIYTSLSAAVGTPSPWSSPSTTIDRCRWGGQRSSTQALLQKELPALHHCAQVSRAPQPVYIHYIYIHIHCIHIICTLDIHYI